MNELIDLTDPIRLYVDLHQHRGPITRVKNALDRKSQGRVLVGADTHIPRIGDLALDHHKMTKKTATDLEAQLEQMQIQLQKMTTQGLGTSGGKSNDQDEIWQEIETLKQSLIICAKAQEMSSSRSNTFEDGSVAEDTDKIVVSTVGDLFLTKPINQDRNRNLAGTVSDATLRQLPQNLQAEPASQASTAAVFEGQHNVHMDVEDLSRVRHNSE